MKFGSITLKLLALVTGSILISALGVLMVADEQLKQIIDRSQDLVYEEKIDAIWQTLDRVNTRLQKTALVEVYTEDFQDSILIELRSIHYQSQNQQIYPFIINSNASVVMHPGLPTGDQTLQQQRFTKQLVNRDKGEFTETYKEVKTWYGFKNYTPWGWTIIYAVPLDIKYRDAHVFINTLMKIMAASTILVLVLLAIVLTRFTKPIVKLTHAASQIAQGDLEKEITVGGKDEIGMLARNFNDMRNAIRQQIDDLKHEINERKQAEINLQRNEENLRTTLNSIGDAVIATDIDGKVVRMNPVAEQLTGWSFEEACDKPLKEIFHIINGMTRDLAESPVEKVLETGAIVELANHTVLISRDSTEFQIADSGAPIRTDTGLTIGVVLVFRDVTQEYTVQKQLQQSQKMDAIGQLAGGVAHDFNNMLAGIVGATELLKQYLIEDSQAKKLHEMILSASGRATSLTQKLLTFARKGPVDTALFDIHKTINETAALLKSTMDRLVELELDLLATDSHMVGDSSQLQHVMLNLAINASHAMPEGGTIVIATRTLMIDLTYCKASTFELSPGPYIEIEIRDTGCGIAPDVLPHIFEPFFTTKAPGKGTGLGLSAAFGTIQQHYGAISVYSELGSGTCFHLLLPLTISEESGQLLESSEQPISGEGKILVVDDEAVVRQTAQMILKKLGYEVLLSENGQQAVELFKQSPNSFDLVILDMVMPEMNGRDCFAALRKINPEVRVVLSSGFSREKDIEQMQANGLKDFIRKPYRSITLSQVVAKAITS